MSRFIKLAVPLILGVGFIYSATANAADMDGEKLYFDKTCHTCHGKDASTPLITSYPSIAGQSEAYLVQQINDIKTGVRSNGQAASMKGIMHLVSDDEIVAISAYLSSLEYKPGKSSSKVVEVAPTEVAAPAAHGGQADVPVDEQKVWMTQGGEREIALSLVPDHENGIEVYEVCAGCHLTEGWGKPDGTFPQLAGQHKEVLVKQLADIRSKNRDNPTMYPFALPESIGDEQAMADVVTYIANIPMNPDNGKGKWDETTAEFAQGKILYDDNCVQCHGETGEGDAAEFYPLIQGQHYNYMFRQFEWIRDGKRRNANPDMIKQIKGFSDKDMAMVINYVSRIPVPKEKLAPSKEWLNPDYD